MESLNSSVPLMPMWESSAVVPRLVLCLQLTDPRSLGCVCKSHLWLQGLLSGREHYTPFPMPSPLVQLRVGQVCYWQLFTLSVVYFSGPFIWQSSTKMYRNVASYSSPLQAFASVEKLHLLFSSPRLNVFFRNVERVLLLAEVCVSLLQKLGSCPKVCQGAKPTSCY